MTAEFADPEEYQQYVATGVAQAKNVVSMVWEDRDANAMGTGFRVGHIASTDGKTTCTFFISAAHNLSKSQKGFRVRFEGSNMDYDLKFITGDTKKDVMLFYVVDAPEGGANLTFSYLPLKPKDKVVAVAYSPLEIQEREEGVNLPKPRLDGVIIKPTIIPSTITCPSFGENPSLQKAFCTCATVSGNSGCPILTLEGQVVGFLMQGDGTSREIATVETIRSFLEDYARKLVKGNKIVKGSRIKDLLDSIVEKYKDQRARPKRGRRTPDG